MIHNLVCLFGHRFVEVLAGFVELVDLVALFESRLKVFLNEQIHRLFSVLYASGSIDARTNLEHDVTHRDFPVGQSADIDDSFQSDARVRVKLTQSVIGKHAVLAHDRYDIGGNAHGDQIQQWSQLVKLYPVVHGKSLHELESHTAARQMIVRISRVEPFGVQDSHGRWQHIVGHMMVADDEVDALFLGIRNLLYSLDAAV